MITLYQFPAGYGLSSVSPFCTKAELYLRLAGVPHEVRDGDPRVSPTRKLPVVVADGETIADSGRIIDWSRGRHGDSLDADLTARQRATAHLIRRAAEEHLYWAIVYSRWIDDAGWVHQRPVIASMLPAPARPFLPGILRSGVRKSLHAHGLGRHDPEQIYAAGAADVTAIADVLADRPFVLGDALSSADAVAAAFLWHVLRTPVESPLTRAAARPAVVVYVQRVLVAAGWEAQAAALGG